MPYRSRLHFLLLPTIGIALGMALVYSLLAVLLFQVLRLPRISQDWLEYFIPAMLAVLPLVWVLRPRTKTLAPLKNGNEPGFIILLLAWLFTVLLTNVATHLALTMTGSLVRVDTASEVLAHPEADFFQLRSVNADKPSSGQFADSTIAGRAGDKLNFRVFLVTPLRDHGDSNILSGVWLSSLGHTSISTRNSDADKRAAYAQLHRRTIAEFEKKDFAQAHYFERQQPGELQQGFIKALMTVSASGTDSMVILHPVFEPFATRSHADLWILGIGFALFTILHAVILAFVQVEHGRFAEYRNAVRSPAIAQLQTGLRWLLAPETRVSKAIAGLLMVVFVYSVWLTGNPVFISGEVLSELGANVAGLTVQGEWWRLLTALALHGGLMHIAMNVGVLLLVGYALEPLVGGWRFLICFLVGGIAGGLASIGWNAHAASVGASGAIFALVGYLFVLATGDRLAPELRHQIWWIFGGIAGSTLLLGMTGLLGNVDNAGHIGGLLAGYLLGWLLLPPVAIGAD